MRMAKSAAAIANWMKRSIFLSSFLAIQTSGSKPLHLGGDAAVECGGVELA